ncbi:GNAT family N-acetyltransferase [Henriciella barbarensis]|uniref:GNAT family N-acetyltransferase n=1 Tax=Henriciella barbarensis TaxID=86342 RepID=A0A399QXI5_9PROT|nr:GNAT family N-acetyltransferase [Henriciella barbarensis]RIJ23836.1 GNAT family N-acetyltransferase [Henriciella barbarensis]
MAASGAITILNEEDSARAAMLHALCFDAAGQWSARSMRETLSAQTTLALGHGDGDQLNGLLLIQRIPPDAEILTICVHPNKRRDGIAQKLFNHSATLLGPYGIDRLMLDVADDNLPAISFYERNEFRRDGRRKAYYRREDGAAADAVLMSRPLAGHTNKSGA